MHPLSACGLVRRRLLAASSLLALGLTGCATSPPQDTGSGRPRGRVPRFSSSGLGELPEGWLPYVLRRDLPPTRYRLMDNEGRRVLHASGRGSCSGLTCEVDADPSQFRRLRWSWRTASVPEEASIGQGNDDSPARLVLGFDGDSGQLSGKDRTFFEFVELLTGKRLPHATLMYVWDAKLPIGSVVRNHRTGRIRYLVVQQGPSSAGEWIAYERDILADFRMVFEEEPGKLRSVGVLTDGDDTKMDLETWYGDVLLGHLDDSR